ncbi:MAG: phosphate ABC transporter substrate-binding protein [Dehalococcoidia bacterium]|nr:phosphate ABC transporter substrate-binding protein [Dehalococcoidia bacterium]
MKGIHKVVLAMVSVVTLSAMLLTGCSGGGGTLTIGGSSTVQPLSEAWAEAFVVDNSEIDISVQGGGSSAGVKGAADGTLDIGAASREMKSDEKAASPELIVYHVAADGVAIVVHPSSNVENLSLADVADVFAAGSNDEWTVINREEGSGTRDVFEELVMSGARIAAKAEFLPSNGAVKEKVASTENAIGYISLGYVDASVKPITVDGVVCNEENVVNGSYPVMRYLNYITNGEAEGTAKAFIDFVLGTAGQDIAAAEGYIKVN